LIAVASPEAESNTKVPDNTRAWRAFDFEIGPSTFMGLRFTNWLDLNRNRSRLEKLGAYEYETQRDRILARQQF
jgi:hypothetical protein